MFSTQFEPGGKLYSTTSLGESVLQSRKLKLVTCLLIQGLRVSRVKTEEQKPVVGIYFRSELTADRKTSLPVQCL